eukprot:3287048-Rhodomonas_salina.1
MSLCLSVSLSLCLCCVRLPVSLSLCLSVSLPVCLSVCLSACLPVCLPVGVARAGLCFECNRFDPRRESAHAVLSCCERECSQSVSVRVRCVGVFVRRVDSMCRCVSSVSPTAGMDIGPRSKRMDGMDFHTGGLANQKKEGRYSTSRAIAYARAVPALVLTRRMLIPGWYRRAWIQSYMKRPSLRDSRSSPLSATPVICEVRH